jgi:hypothetical protein
VTDNIAATRDERPQLPPIQRSFRTAFGEPVYPDTPSQLLPKLVDQYLSGAGPAQGSGWDTYRMSPPRGERDQEKAMTTFPRACSTSRQRIASDAFSKAKVLSTMGVTAPDSTMLHWRSSVAGMSEAELERELRREAMTAFSF